jgi:DDE superfamily endonuclease
MNRAIKPHSRLLKKLPEEVEKLHQAYPEASIELWSQDEHRIGLKPILRRVWARKGTRVRAVVRPRYQWMYLYGFVEPRSGKTSWLLMPTVNTTAFSLALSAFAQEQGVGPNKHLLLVAGPSLAGTGVPIFRFLKGCISCSCPLIRQSCNQQNACGPSQTNRSPTES